MTTLMPEFRFSGDCLDYKTVNQIDRTGNDPGPFIIRVRCNICKNCMRSRRREWINRMALETERTERTVFLTGTFYDSTLRECDQYAHEKRDNMEYETCKKRSDYLYKQFQDFCKRLRKQAPKGAKLLYCPIMEIGNGKTIMGKPSRRAKEGNPHFHVMLHFNGWKPTMRLIEATWCKVNDKAKIGRARAKLVTDPFGPEANYITKYIAKELGFRKTYGKYKGRKITASMRYGKGWQARMAQYFDYHFIGPKKPEQQYYRKLKYDQYQDHYLPLQKAIAEQTASAIIPFQTPTTI